MTDKEILLKAIEKAVSLGFVHPQIQTENPEMTSLELLSTYNENFLIFNHDFAKAFFGEDRINVNVGNTFPHYTSMEKWKYHLSKMVLEENPIKYLERFLND